MPKVSSRAHFTAAYGAYSGGSTVDLRHIICRQVGLCLRHLSADLDAEFNVDTVPWQRVINSRGEISPRYAKSHDALPVSSDRIIDAIRRGRHVRQRHCKRRV
jgi:hypothetical protein